MKIINEDPKQKGSIKTMKLKGRKSKLTHELIEKISLEVEAGNYYKMLVQKLGFLRVFSTLGRNKLSPGSRGYFWILWRL